MSTTGQNSHQLKLDIQHELITANQLLNTIRTEILSIKNFTSPGGPLESLVKKGADSISSLANIHEVNLESIAPIRRHLDNVTLTNHNQAEGEEDTLRNDTDMGDSQMKLVY